MAKILKIKDTGGSQGGHSPILELESESELEPELERKASSPLKKEKIQPCSLHWIKNLDPASISSFTAKYEIHTEGVRRVANSLVLWCESKGKTYKNYKAALENWIQRDHGLRSDRKTNKL